MYLRQRVGQAEDRGAGNRVKQYDISRVFEKQSCNGSGEWV